ncbi:MAG: hypothetical protein RI900_2890 [Actinomycetota bacterium]|jgi:AcrR family transcriptional regulator
MTAARAALVDHGIDHVRVAVLADRLGVARSSFYWYFADRDELAEALLEQWQVTNTSSLLERCARRSTTITEAMFAVFECWADPALFDVPLEFAVREWARRDDTVRQRLADADRERIGAIAALHRRHGYPAGEALVRARVQYHSQIGMYALGIHESTADRLRMVRDYVKVFTGVEPSAAELQGFRRRVRSYGKE